ncbi:PREDICTED: tumor necrosis factor receptor superfamily member 10A-like [Nipponia nippon]|uniref:tumor necrosis factor receptor superfamily member 10A-like n=1 Tax=Nipponia nippon TaxID=128390 RepID=UPI0005109EB1|nr:PREDICTED: tumor necrosis factor receptor superfamily member 10A-like [Nipponia nippon]
MAITDGALRGRPFPSSCLCFAAFSRVCAKRGMYGGGPAPAARKLPAPLLAQHPASRAGRLGSASSPPGAPLGVRIPQAALKENPKKSTTGFLMEVMLLIMAGTRAEDCREGEYLNEGLCCLSCPAGTYVAQHCSASHLRGRCIPCIEGEGYTAHENGLEECLPCRQCKEDQITLRPCTLMHDTECQCKQGYFCPVEGCEICQRCSTMCPEGKEIVQNCNATMDLGCGLPDQGSTAIVCVIVIILVVVVGGLVLFFVCRKLKSDKAASTDKDAEKGLESEGSTESLILPEVETPANNAANPEGENSGESPEAQAQTSINLEDTSPEKVREPKCRIIVKDLSQKELRDSFGAFINEVPPKKWKRLMRTHLQENDIVKIIYDFPNDIEEQFYQMLLMWKNTLGEKQCIIKLLDELRCLDTKAYDNVLNTLKSNNIISKLEATD